MGDDRLRVICGPTAAGKSALALELCEAFDAAIVSADSRQIYCYFNIGTAKPMAQDCARIPHYGIDVAEPEERYSAARWASEADEWMECAREIDKEPLIVGGTGLYVRALFDPLFSEPQLDSLQRSQLGLELESKSVDELCRWCEELDPDRAHLGRTQLIRAIEIALLSGARISELHAQHKRTTTTEADRKSAVYLLVDSGSELGPMIEDRVKRMFKAGWSDEVRDLLTRVPPEAPAWKASGYAVMRDYVEGRLDLSSARERVIIETRQYAKRQRTWFRHQLPSPAVTILNPQDSRARSIAREWWERAE